MTVIMYILDFTVSSAFTNLAGLAQAFLVCSLPLSALWASHESEVSGPERGNITTTSTSVSHSSRSSRFRNRFRFFKPSKDSRSNHSDLEKAPSYSDGDGSKKSVSVDTYNANLHPTVQE
jgi:hypothetical protein